jgi:hypothetical protein
MLTLDRIMWIAREHARSCCGPGELNSEDHNIQVLSVAIQEALSENDDGNKRPRKNGKFVKRVINDRNDMYKKDFDAKKMSSH